MASRSIGSIYAELTLRDGGFQRGLSSARKSLNTFGGVAVAAAAGGVVALGAALTAGTIRTLDQVDALGDLAAQTGVTISEMMILQRAYKDGGRAAEMAGADIGKMQKNLVKAASGGDDPFKAIGLSAQELLKDSPAKQFEAIGAAIMRIANPAERTAKSMEIFGKGGMGLITVFGGIADAKETLGKWPALAEKFGGAMGRANDIIGQLPAKSDAFFGGFTAGIIGELLPNLEKLKKVDFTDIGQKLGVAVSTGFQSLSDGSLWELFKLQGEKAIASIQVSPAMSELAATINTIFDGITSTWDDKFNFDETFNKYAAAGIASNTELVDDLQSKIDDVNKGIADKYKSRSDAAAGMSIKTAIADPIVDLSAMELASKVKPLSDTSKTEVNDYQRRGLSLDGAQKDLKIDKQTNLLTEMRDALKILAARNGNLVW